MEILRTLQVVFGIGLVIFVHEAGHFIAARICKVRVDVFSLGFGPRLLGWKRGDTMYQIAAIPVGGFVKMFGEMPDARGRAPRGDELWSKSVGQRFFIYSGGVLMNVVFALVAFPFVFAAGVPVTRPIIDAPSKGMPAWQAGLEPGTEIVAVEGDEMFDFTNIYTAVALADAGPLEFTIRRPGSSDLEMVSLEPERDPAHGIYRIGVELGRDPELRLTVLEGGVGHGAGLRQDDVLLGVVDGLSGMNPVGQLRRAFVTAEPFSVRVRRGQEEHVFEVIPEQKEFSDKFRFGFSPLQNQVQGLRPNPDLDPLGLAVGERILAVDGSPIARSTHWLAALLAAEAAPVVRIEGLDGIVREATFPRPLDQLAAVRANQDLFLSFDPNSTRIEVASGQPVEAAGVATGDRLRGMDGRMADSWESLFELAQTKAKRAEPVLLTYERCDSDGVWRSLEVEATPKAVVIPVYGFDVLPAKTIYRTDSVGSSIREGVSASWRFLADTWLTLKKMVLGRVSANNVGGIITIGKVSYSWASEGWAKLFFFLCMLSINLAFLNVLPIPVLDGGHLFFCVVEKIKGSPVSERTLGYSQLVGLVVILTLMVYVTYQDVLRIL